MNRPYTISRDKFIEEGPGPTLSRVLLDHEIVMIENFVEPAGLIQLRDAVFEWGKGEPVTIDLDRGKQNVHRIDDNPASSMTPHLMHIYNFWQVDAWREGALFRKVIQPLVDLQESLSCYFTGGTLADQGLRIRPQLIHYPRGAGYFEYHTHPLKPQLVGLICSMTGPEDSHSDLNAYAQFKTEAGEVACKGIHHLGSVTLFRYDLPHRVHNDSPKGTPYRFDDPAGKWSLVMPVVPV